MGNQLRVLIVEDSEDDAILLVRKLQRGGYDPVFERVDTKEAMAAALDKYKWDVIISDFVMPNFSGLEALRLLQNNGLDIPFIIVSGRIGEDIAVEAMKAGAHDYIMKGNLARLIPAIKREIDEASVRRERRHAEKELHRVNRALWVLSESNQALLRAKNEKKLLHEICKIIVEAGGYCAAWVGFVEEDKKKAMRSEVEYKEGYPEAKADTGIAPSLAAVRTGKPSINRNMLTDDKLRAEAVKLKCAASISVPLPADEQVSGVLNIYAKEPDAFDQEEVKLLTELACDLAYGITVLRLRAGRRRVEKQIRQSLKEKEILLREIHHRVKNNMQIISSLLRLQSEFGKDENASGILKESQNRIMSMALIHEKLYHSKKLYKIDIKEYISDLINGLFQSYKVSRSKVALNLNVEDFSLGIDSAIPCGLVINELITNSLKHAFPEGEGEIDVFIRSKDNSIELTVGDNGVGIPKDMDIRRTKSLGLHLVTLLVENQLNGEIDLIRDKGTEFHIKFKGGK